MSMITKELQTYVQDNWGQIQVMSAMEFQNHLRTFA